MEESPSIIWRRVHKETLRSRIYEGFGWRLICIWEISRYNSKDVIKTQKSNFQESMGRHRKPSHLLPIGSLQLKIIFEHGCNLIPATSSVIFFAGSTPTSPTFTIVYLRSVQATLRLWSTNYLRISDHVAPLDLSTNSWATLFSHIFWTPHYHIWRYTFSPCEFQ